MFPNSGGARDPFPCVRSEFTRGCIVELAGDHWDPGPALALAQTSCSYPTAALGLV
jgi:hypothetical protein